jgi:oligopeptide transport system substrate-binding protein
MRRPEITLRIRLLGTAQLSHNNQPIIMRGYKPLALLAYLLVTGKAHSRQHLVDLLFDGPGDPKASLRWTLSKLRKVIGSNYVLADRQQIAFNFESDYWLDVTEFEAGQLDLYRGDFLEGFHLRDSFGFEDWAFFERERLRESYQTALEQQCAEAESRGDRPAVIETAHRLLRLDNLREDWYRLLMRVYAQQGKREVALAQFDQCRQVLQAELDVEPIAETLALAEAIQQGQFEPLRPDPARRAHRIAGRFIIEDLDQDLLGQGTMGQVYRGKDTQTGQPVAIKVIKPDIIAAQPQLVQRFVREGEALRRLNHPNIVKLVAAAEEEGRHYLMMEYVEGGSLEDLLETQGPLPLDRTLDLALDLADALTRAHRLNILHRDLKSANILLTPDGALRLADFGLARLGDRPRLTQTGLLMGTVDYLSPEACEGKALDARADIWSFGVLIYEMLTGKRPFLRETLAATLSAILTQPTPNLTEQRHDIPEALAGLIDRMLAKDPQQRVPSVRLVGAELEAILQGRETPRHESEEELTLAPVRPPTPVPQRPRFPTSLVGREAEMATLRQLWQRASQGQGQIILVEGEPGIGKTRLVEELLAEVANQAVILRTKAPAMQNPLAYTLFVDPLRQLLSGERPPGLSDIWLAEVSRLLPELRDRYPDLPPSASLEPAAERRRLFDAVCTTLLARTGQRPLLFFVDDLQWADATSLELLNHLSSLLPDKPVCIIGTYRPHEVEAKHPLREPRRAWQRAGLLTQVELAPLSDGAVAGLLRELTTWQGEHPSFGDLIFRETGGNPLFVVETVANLRDEGRLPQDAAGWLRDFRTESVAIPGQVQTLIEARLSRLDDVSRQIITTSAVMRSRFRANTVQTVSGRNELETLEGLEHLLAAGLLVEQGAEQFTFSHDKIREVAYGSLSQLRRKLLHRRVAETLEQQHRGRETAIAGQLAYHFEQAGHQEKALHYHLEAGHAAQAQYAHEAAIEHYHKAVAMLKAQEDFEQAAQISMQLGLVQHQVFDFQGAQQAYEEAFALRQQVGDVLSSPSPTVPRTFRMATSDSPDSLDSSKAGDTLSDGIIRQLFSGLVETDAHLEVVPNIARSWEILDGGRRYVFHLRDDVYWSDGQPVTAADFEYAWKRVLDPATNSPSASMLYDVKAAKAFHQGQISDPNQVGVYARDPLTLEVVLEETAGYFLHLVAHTVTYPLPRQAVEAYGHAWTAVEHIVTNGPFRLERWTQDESMILSRNRAYHGQATGNVNRVELSLSVRDPVERLDRYEVDDLDAAAFPDQPLLEVVDRVRQRHPGEFVSLPRLETSYASFDATRPPFNDPRVRQAFALATDQETLADVVLGGYDLPATGGFVPPGMPGHSPDIGLPYDPAQARQLLAEAGYPAGHGFPTVVWWLHSRFEGFGAYLQQQWRENLGLDLKWEALALSELAERLAQKPAHLFIFGWTADYADPDSFLRVCLAQPQFNWQHETFDRLVREARRVPHHEARMSLYRQADQILIQEALILPLTHPKILWLFKPRVKKFASSPTEWWFPKDIIIEPHEAQPNALPSASHTLRTAAEGEPDTLDPTLCSDTTSGIIIDQLFRGLVTETPGMEFVPDVAQRWEILADGRKYIFHLRSDVTWSDGTPLTAADFEYAWKRVLNPATGSVDAPLLYEVKGARAFHQGQVSNPDSVGVSALDKHTLAVELERPTSYFLNLLAIPITFPVPQHVVEVHGETWTDAEYIVTNGPFTLEAWRKGEVMSLRRNRAYQGPFSGNVERVEVFFSGDDLATELTWYEAGRLDVTRLPPQKGEAKQQHSGEYITRPILRTYALSFNKSRPPFVDLRVRQALILAIDRPGLLDTFTEIYGVPATGGLCPPGMPGHSADIGLPYDLVQARHLFAEAGYPEGHDFPEIDWLMVEFLEPLADYLQEQWKRNLGIHRFNKQSASWGTFEERAKQAQPALLLWGWVADYPDPDNFLRVCLQHLLPGWRNETFDRLVEQAGCMTDPHQRIELYQQADKILIEDAVLMPLTYGRYPLLVKPWVKQYVYAPHRRVFWQDVVIEPH